MHRIRRRSLVAVLVLGVVLGVACSRPIAPLPQAPVPSPTAAPPIVFPTDAGPHDALTEWWYYTGHLESPEGRAYGFEFTVFQVRRQDAPTGYLAHFAVSDIGGQRFSHQAHFVQGDPVAAFPIDVDGWTLGTDGSADVIQADMQAAPGADPPFGIQLRLTDEKPPALHHGGYIDYGSAGGSYYYSRTRLAVSGALRQADGASVPVSGVAWMDHQWGNFVISATGGWDWYSLQLDDNTELMLYVLRGANGETTSVYGTQVPADGSTRDLDAAAVSVRATGSWTSPHTGGVYPSGWEVTLADGGQLVLQPQLRDQELYFPAAEPGAASGTSASSGVASTSSATGAPGPSGALATSAATAAAAAAATAGTTRASGPPSGASGRLGATNGTGATTSGVTGGTGAAGVSSLLAYWEGAVTVSGARTGVGYVELTGYAGR